MVINLQCPSCAATRQVPAALVGKKVECSKCKFRFVVQADGQSAIAPSAAPQAAVAFPSLASIAQTSSLRPRDAAKPQAIDPPDIRFNIVAAVAWICVAGLVANSASWLTVSLGDAD